MSNAPDRFDGFHSFNLCCRKTADTGRHETNLRLYSTDRRVFEYWSEGDWIAADRLMGLVDAKFRDHPCADGGVGPPSLDHIGPLSLGFMHRPAFRLLSRAANSAKNNRMTLWDVRHLIESERQGTLVISWYARNLWDARKADARDEERALRLSKLLRDNQRSAMQLLGSLLANEHFVFLASLLELDRADYNVEFDNLRINQDCVTVFDRVLHTTRNTKYAQEQKARRLRVAFDALRIYAAKDNRHMLRITDSQVNDHVRSALQAVEHLPKTTQDLQVELRRLLVGQVAPSDDALREIADRISRHRDASDQFAKSRRALGGAMKVIAQRLSSMWDSERYVRAPFDFEES
jgi:Alw26I/Eco31I/Esp3I family type II restriction endonuclease